MQWKMFKLLRQTDILQRNFSVLFAEYTVGFPSINIFERI